MKGAPMSTRLIALSSVELAENHLVWGSSGGHGRGSCCFLITSSVPHGVTV